MIATEETVEMLVKRYGEAAAAHGRATEAGDHKKANKAYEQVAAIYRELRRRGPNSQRALLPFLNDPDPGVLLRGEAVDGVGPAFGPTG